VARGSLGSERADELVALLDAAGDDGPGSVGGGAGAIA